MEGTINVRQLMHEQERDRKANDEFWERQYHDAERMAVNAWWACTNEQEREEVRRKHELYLSTGMVRWKAAKKEMAKEHRRIYLECVRRGWIVKAKCPVDNDLELT